MVLRLASVQFRNKGKECNVGQRHSPLLDEIVSGSRCVLLRVLWPRHGPLHGLRSDKCLDTICMRKVSFQCSKLSFFVRRLFATYFLKRSPRIPIWSPYFLKIRTAFVFDSRIRRKSNSKL